MKETLNLDLLARLIPQLVALAKKHWASCNWQEGAPTGVFADDGFICIRYASGRWWHYDLARNEWFQDFASPLLHEPMSWGVTQKELREQQKHRRKCPVCFLRRKEVAS